MLERSNFYYQAIFKKLFSIGKDILEQYQVLMTLEMQNQKDSSQYQQGISKLMKLIKEEESYYELLKTDRSIINILLRKLIYFNKNSNDFIIPKNDNSKTYTRMSLQLGKAITTESEGKAIEVFSAYNKLDMFNLLHFETIILALILFKTYITNKDSLNFLFLENLYNRSYMFPYVEEIMLANRLFTPEFLYSLVDVYSYNTNVSDDEITTYKNKRAEQLKTFLEKTPTDTTNYVFLLFYLKALDSPNWQELIDNCILPKEDKEDLEFYLRNKNVSKLVRSIHF